MVTKEQVKKCLDKFANDYLSTREETECFDYAIKVVDEHKTGWIPVTERLPDKNGRYLCTWKNENGICVDFGLYEDGEWYVSGAIAWMPLPKPYEGSDSDAVD